MKHHPDFGPLPDDLHARLTKRLAAVCNAQKLLDQADDDLAPVINDVAEYVTEHNREHAFRIVRQSFRNTKPLPNSYRP